MEEAAAKRRYLSEKEKILREFRITISSEIHDRLSELYPSDICVENYTRTLILNHLDKK